MLCLGGYCGIDQSLKILTQKLELGIIGPFVARFGICRVTVSSTEHLHGVGLSRNDIQIEAWNYEHRQIQ